MAGKSTSTKSSPPVKRKPGKKKNADGAAREPQDANPSNADTTVVGMGASAGGLEALQQFFKHLPVGCTLSFVVIQHLSPRYKSSMDQLLTRSTALPITQINNGLKIERGRIYLSPPEKLVSMVNGKFRLTPMQYSGRRHLLPIDHFFNSLAMEKREKAVCIILSGSASDGTQGLKAVKAAGGLTFVQSPEDARYASMPDSAIATQMVDFILPAEEIAEKLTAVLWHPGICSTDVSSAKEKSQDHELKQIFSIVQSKTGHDFSNYKSGTISRRIARRLTVHQISDYSDYVKVMATDPAEAGRLVKDMLIGVTSFFRDGKAFDTLREMVLTPLVQSRKPGDGIRIWVAGCSSGQEAYSIAILLAEVMERLNHHLNVQVFASDIETEAIQTARQGAYPENIAADVSRQRRGRFFTSIDGRYHIKKRIRDQIVFSVHNLINDPPFSKIDLISCRNLLIYLKPELQKKILLRFHYALNPGGHLFLGPSETTGECGDYFPAVSLKHKIFEHRERGQMDRYAMNGLPVIADHRVLESAAEQKGKSSLPDIYSVAERIILDEYSPPGVLIDSNFDILQFYGYTDPFLKMPRGKANFNILKVAREGLSFKLAQCLSRVVQSGETEHVEGVAVKSPDGLNRVTVSVRPLLEKPGGRNLLIVLFEAATNDRPKEAPQAPSGDAGEKPPDTERLEKELNATREYLQTTIEELETSNEEYKAANEELQSVNEELQSANEELETSREELQSTNEELLTVNAEHQQKIDELTKSNNDINNLLESTEIASLFLDLDLCVRRFTPAMTRIINLRLADIGRPVSDITTLMEATDIHAHATQVLERLERKKFEVRDKNGRWYEMRLMPYRTLDNVIDGVTLAFIDITDLRQIHLLRRITAVFENASDAVTVQDFNGNILSWNRAAERLYGWMENEATQMHITEITAEKNRHEYAAITRRLQRGDTVEPFETTRITKTGKALTVRLHATTLVDDKQHPVKFATFERPSGLR